MTTYSFENPFNDILSIKKKPCWWKIFKKKDSMTIFTSVLFRLFLFVIESRFWDSCIIVNLLRTIRWVPILKKLYFVYAKYDPPVLHCLAVKKQRSTVIFSRVFSFDLWILPNCSYVRIFMAELWKNEQLEFTINVNNKKWLFHHQKKIFQAILTKIQFSVIFGNFFSVFAYFFALKSVGRFWILYMSNNRSKPS